MRSLRKSFPNSTIGIVSQTGAEQTERVKGVTVELHWRRDDKWPFSAEVFGGDLYVDIGLGWEGDKLVDYDGVFDLPAEVREMLKGEGAVLEV